MNYKYKGEVFIPFELLETVTLYYMLNDLMDTDGIPQKPEATLIVELIKEELRKRKQWPSKLAD